MSDAIDCCAKCGDPRNAHHRRHPFVSGGISGNNRADAPLTPAEAMECPQVAAAYLALQSAQESIATFMGVHGYPKDSGAGLVLDEVSAALAPFTTS